MRFAAARLWCLCTIAGGVFTAACTLVVGDLPDALPAGGRGAGAGTAAGSGSAGDSKAGGASGVAGAGAPGGGGASGPCDADGDQYVAEGTCGGDDCDDEDPDVHPNQAKYFKEPQAQVQFDYDCSGGPEREQQEPIVCSALSLDACATDAMGFLGSLPKCGETGSWGSCAKSGMPPLQTCVESASSDAQQMRCH